MAPGLGIGPRSTVSKTAILPLDDPGISLIISHNEMAGHEGFEPSQIVLETIVLPLH